ncbi:hypothetical protein ACFE04_021452 [Oxalis oulophora]
MFKNLFRAVLEGSSSGSSELSDPTSSSYKESSMDGDDFGGEWDPALFFNFVIVMNFTFCWEKLHLRSCRLLSGMSMYNIEIPNSSYKISKWAMEMDNNMHL